MVLSLLVLSLPDSVDRFHHTEQRVEVNGTVTDVNGARVPGASVEIITKERKQVVLTATDGTYAIQLEPGTYQIRVSKFGFCDGHRGAFALKKKSQITFDFQLLVCGINDR